MVLSKETLSDEEAWEIISGASGSIDEEAASIPLISHDSPSHQLLPPDNTDYVSARQEQHDDLQLDEEDACIQHQSDILIEDEDTMISGVSSITGDHQTVVSDVHEEDEVIEEEHIEENGSNNNTKSIKEKDDLQLVDQLTQMGFKEEEIKIAISNLREAGQTEIDADSIIGQIMGEDNNANHNSNNNQDPTNPLELPLRSTWEFVESTAQNLDRQHQLRQSINRSAKELWSNVKDESQKIQSNFRNTCNQADVQARNATAHVQSAASSAKESIVRANEEYSIAEKVAAAAVVGGATLLALGNPRAGVGAMAVAGATLAAGEVVKAQSESTRDYGLRQGVHLD